jgi:hypothetical protein
VPFFDLLASDKPAEEGGGLAPALALNYFSSYTTLKTKGSSFLLWCAEVHQVARQNCGAFELLRVGIWGKYIHHPSPPTRFPGRFCKFRLALFWGLNIINLKRRSPRKTLTEGKREEGGKKKKKKKKNSNVKSTCATSASLRCHHFHTHTHTHTQQPSVGGRAFFDTHSVLEGKFLPVMHPVEPSPAFPVGRSPGALAVIF